ncbi:MAG TPA: hypothetical protein VHE55_01995 [Fimbriimonadaceae bacterium]|nr:hypothetical protein [Fimbriimonadaceae bacterium]
MLTCAIAALTLGFNGPQPPLCCPSTLEEIKGAPAISMEYAGAMFGTCCGGCDTPFVKDPTGLIAKAIKADKTVGAFEYDPVTGFKVDPAKAEAFSDYKAIRYFFATADEKKTFDAKPTKFVTDVKSEAYFCPVMEQPTTSKDAAGYSDYNGVRYFMCCTYCVKKFRANPLAYVAKSAAAVKPLTVVVLKK